MAGSTSICPGARSQLELSMCSNNRRAIAALVAASSRGVMRSVKADGSSAFGGPAVVVDPADPAAGTRRRRLGAGAGRVVEALVPDGLAVGEADRLRAVLGVADEPVTHEVVLRRGQTGAPGNQAS